MTVIRPSDREIDKKITQAIEAVKNKRRYVVNKTKLFGEFDALDVDTTPEIWKLVILFLHEIKELKPIELYKGKRPPEKSYELEIDGKELWAYRWKSDKMKK